VRSLGGFPGTYASYVYKTIGPAGVLSLLSGKDDRCAEFVSAVAYAENPGRAKLFVGSLRGKLAKQPRGSGGFGFDPIFIPRGETRTLAELSLSEKCAVSHRAAALRALGIWLKSRASG